MADVPQIPIPAVNFLPASGDRNAMLLGIVQLQLSGLGGLDRQRPLSVVVPTVSMSDTPPVAVVLPYTEQDAILQTLRGFFPQTIVEDGERLSLHSVLNAECTGFK